MRSPVFAFRSRRFGGAALVVILAGMSASCSNSLRLQEPFFTSSTDNQRQIIGDSGDGMAYQQPMPPVAQNNSVTRSDLPPPPSTQYASVDPSADYGAPAATGEGAYEWSAVGGRVVTIGAGESLDSLTAKFGVPGEQILAANQMTSPAQVKIGRVMVIPRRVAISPDRLRSTDAPMVADAQPIPAPIKPPPQQTIATGAATYTVQAGETLFGVARKTGMTPMELANLNGIGTDTQLQVGQTLRLKSGAMVASNDTKPTQLGAPPKPLGQLVVNKDAGTTTAVATTEPKLRLTSPAETAATGQLVANAPKIPVVPAMPDATPTDVKATADIDDAADAASADGKSFRWPVRGRIISGFGSKPNGEKNDGINLAVPEGTSVKAVEAGTVIYAGNELAGYGNLILIRHADGWVSAYAHNKDLLVKRGDTIRRGQTIAHAGMTGSVTAPQVHFELRKGAKPVNPLDYLAGA
ncbi:MAG TPA: peptidoglycan DD-metalloendopeptidase family protein [Bauldia sp.]|nr:peptidoglycan DD-metalloendopeptidase family protein [Bauldia sp.]